MSRISHFSIALGFVLLGIGFYFVGTVIFLSLAAGQDSKREPSLFDSSSIVFSLTWGAAFVGIGWGALHHLKRAFRSTPSAPVSPKAPPPETFYQLASGTTPNERLASLLQKRDDTNV